MSVTYTVSPASGDSYATIYSSSSMTSSSKLGTLSKGTVITVNSTKDKYYVIKYTGSNSTTSSSIGTVNTNSGLNGRSGPGTSYAKKCAFSNGTKLTITDTKNGWYEVSGRSTTGDVTGVWVSAQYVKTSATQTEAYISKSDVKTSTTSTSDDDSATYLNQLNKDMAYRNTYDTNFNESYKYSGEQRYVGTEEYYKQLMAKMNCCFGTPPKYNMDIDIQYVSDVGLGRVLGNTFYANPSILSICPGKVKMFPHLFNKTKRDAAFNALYNAASGDSSIAQRIMGDKDNDLFNGALYEFTQDTQDYAKRVNLLCRSCAELLGIGDSKMPYTSVPLRKFDYTYWSIRKQYTPSGGGSYKANVFTNFWNGLGAALSGGITDQNYIHFLVSNENTQVSESVSTSIEDSFISSLFNSSNSIANQLSYFSGIGFNDQSDVQENINNVLNGIVGESGWTKLVDNVVSGGKLKIPQIVGDTNFSQSVSCSLTFVSPYGSPLSVFLWCIVPICHLYAFALPKQLSDSMYSYPYILKVYQKGWFNSNLAVMSNISMTRGGSDGTSWSSAGLATEWTVNFDITPLYSQLTLPSTDHPLLFLRNDGLVDFLGNMCGFDLKANNLDVKINLLTAFIETKFTGIPNDILRWTSDKVSGAVSKVFQLG